MKSKVESAGDREEMKEGESEVREEGWRELSKTTCHNKKDENTIGIKAEVNGEDKGVWRGKEKSRDKTNISETSRREGGSQEEKTEHGGGGEEGK